MSCIPALQESGRVSVIGHAGALVCVQSTVWVVQVQQPPTHTHQCRMHARCRSTLLQVPGSMLHEMFCLENQHRLIRSSRGEVFLDLEPAAFALVLRFLRELKMSGGE
jgi:hypothetical protein